MLLLQYGPFPVADVSPYFQCNHRHPQADKIPSQKNALPEEFEKTEDVKISKDSE